MKLLQLFLILTCIGCGRDESELLNQDPYFNRYEQEFRELAEVYGWFTLPPVSIVFSDLSHKQGPVVGLCYSSVRKRIVQIDYTFWQNSSETSRTTLIRHELGHCLLGRDHTENGYMAPAVLSDSYVKKHEAKLLQELFKR